MLESVNQSLLRNSNWKSSIISSFVALISVLFTQFALYLIPQFIPISSFVLLLPVSVVAIVFSLGLGRLCKKIAGVRASAPAFVFFSIVFVWAVYTFVIRGVISPLMDIIFNLEIVMMLIGLCRIMLLDPGFVTHPSSYDDDPLGRSPLSDNEAATEDCIVRRRARYCRICRSYVLGFDHHCPAFGNCIGQRNHRLFIILLIGFLVSEASFVSCACQYTAKFETLDEVGAKLVASTTLFCLVQVLWKVVFLMWHVYCACFNIKTDEWINWRKYPEFHIEIDPDPGRSHTAARFRNPYDKGILRNLKEFATAKG